MAQNINRPYLSPQQIEKAYWIWKESLPHKSFDLILDPLLRSPQLSPLEHALNEVTKTPEEQNKMSSYGKLRLVREALFLSSNHLSERLSISRRTYCKIEESEQKGTISLNKLKTTAEAMDCELVYFLRPKSGRSYSREIWQKVLPLALQKLPPQLAEHQKAKRLALAAMLVFEKAEFREKNRLTQREKTIF